MNNCAIVGLLVLSTAVLSYSGSPLESSIVFFSRQRSLLCAGILVSQNHILTTNTCSSKLDADTKLTFKISKIDFHITSYKKESNLKLTLYQLKNAIEIGTHLLPELPTIRNCNRKTIYYTFDVLKDDEYSTNHVMCTGTSCNNPFSCQTISTVHTLGMPLFCDGQTLLGISTSFELKKNCGYFANWDAISDHRNWIQSQMSIPWEKATTVPNILPTSPTTPAEWESAESVSSSSETESTTLPNTTPSEWEFSESVSSSSTTESTTIPNTPPEWEFSDSLSSSTESTVLESSTETMEIHQTQTANDKFILYVIIGVLAAAVIIMATVMGIMSLKTNNGSYDTVRYYSK